MSTPAQMALAVRRMAKDWGLATLKAAEDIDSSETAIDVSEVPNTMKAGMYLEWGTELVQYVSGAASPITVIRGSLGTTATTHSNGALAVVQPRYTNTAMTEALNEALELLSGLYPRDVYVTDSTLETASDTESLSMPAEPASEGEYLDILGVEIETATSGLYRPAVNWTQEGRFPPTLKFFGVGTTGRAIRLHLSQAYYPMAYTDAARPTGLTDATERFLVRYAAGLLLEFDDIYAADFVRQDTQAAADFRGRAQVIGRNLQAGALEYLARVQPGARVVRVGDTRNYRR